MSFVLHLTFDDAYECMVGQVKNNDMYGRSIFYTAANYEFELYKKPKENGWYKVPFSKPNHREFTRNDQYWTRQVSVAFINSEMDRIASSPTPGSITFRNGATITNVNNTARSVSISHEEHMRLQQEYNRRAAEIALQIHTREAERRAAQREEERRRLEEERNRPSFLRRINPFGRR